MGDAAAVHIKCAALHHHAAAGLALSVGDLAVCRLAALAVAEGEGHVLEHVDDITAAILRDFVAVQAEHRVGFRHPWNITTTIQLHIFGQVVIARGVGQSVRAVPRGKVDRLAVGAAGAGTPIAAAAEVVLMRLYRRLAVVEFHVDVAGVSVLLHLDEVSPACVGDEIAFRAAVRPAGCDGDRLARVERPAGHADLGAYVQTALTDGDELVFVQIHVVLCLAHPVAGNGHLSGHGKRAVAVSHTHAGKIEGGILCDAAAGHGEFAAIYVDTAAIAVDPAVGISSGVFLDRAAVHGKFTAVHIHAAAVAQGFIFANAAAVHMELTAAHIHAGASAVVTTFHAALVVLNLSVVQRECTARPDNHAVTRVA